MIANSAIIFIALQSRLSIRQNSLERNKHDYNFPETTSK